MLAYCKQPEDEVHLSAGNNGQEIEITVQAEVLISLVAKPGTGYSWSVAQTDSNKLDQVGESVFTEESEQLGAPAQQVFRFKPKTAGSVQLKLIYHRAWEKAVAPADSFEVKLNIINRR